MIDEKLKDDIKALVASIFSEKEDLDVRKKTEEALNKSAETINDLTEALEAKNVSVEEASKKAVELEASVTSLKVELEAARKEKEEADQKFEKANNELLAIAKEKTANERMSTLETSGVVRTDKASQKAKVADMTEDEFAAYKDELVSIKADVLKSLEEAAKIEADKLAAEKAAADKAAAAAAAGDTGDADIKTPPANVDTKGAENAALNLESASNDMVSKYAALGAAMAASMKAESKK
jgi:colicin import membrane protein